MKIILRKIFIILFIMSPSYAVYADCINTDKNEQSLCEGMGDIVSNVRAAHHRAKEVMGDNESLSSLDELYKLQVNNCNNYKCLTDVSSKYYYVLSNSIRKKPVHVDKRLTLDEACEYTTNMRYYSALAAYSPLANVKASEDKARSYANMVLINDVSTFINAYAQPASIKFRQAYREGDAAFNRMFSSMIGSCKSVPANYLISLPDLVRSNAITFDELIEIYKR